MDYNMFTKAELVEVLTELERTVDKNVIWELLSEKKVKKIDGKIKILDKEIDVLIEEAKQTKDEIKRYEIYVKTRGKNLEAKKLHKQCLKLLSVKTWGI